MVKIQKTPTIVKKSLKAAKARGPAKKKPAKRNFRGLFKGRQQKGKIAVVGVIAFAAVGASLLLPSFAASGDKKPQGTYTNWSWTGTGVPQDSSMLDTFLTIESDPTLAHPGYGYYWASQFGMVQNGGYMGIQTRGEAGSYTGKVAIFALWSATQGVENGSPGSYCNITSSNFDGGGSTDQGSSCRIPLNWQTGDSYRLRVAAVAADATTRTWQASVYNQKTGQELVIGKIKTTLSYGLLQPWLSNWTEYYSGGRTECEMPYSRVVFGTPKFNNAYAPASHENNLTAGACPSVMTNLSNGVRHEQGNPSVSGTLEALPTGGTYISDMNWSSATTGYGVITKDKSVTNDGQPINLAGKTFTKGLGVHAISEIKYALGGQYSRFVSYVNLQYGASGTVNYQVWADGVKLFDSGVMDSLSITKAVNVDVTGKQELRLVVSDASDGINADWAAWADARLIPGSSTPPPPPPAGDTTAPSITITSPPNGSNIGYWAPVGAKATDNVKVTKMELYIDGVLKSSTTSSSLSYTWISYNVARGNHNLTVKAYDAAGNVGQNSITVVK